jgi:hypothetical protein
LDFESAQILQVMQSNTQFIDQATLTYAVNDNISVMAGRFYSFFGYEGARNNADWNYLKSIAKIGSPYWHEGFGATYDVKNGFMVSAYVLDGVEDQEDATADSDADGTVDNLATNQKGYGATASYAMDKWRAEFDYYVDSNRTNTSTAGEILSMHLISSMI